MPGAFASMCLHDTLGRETLSALFGHNTTGTLRRREQPLCPDDRVSKISRSGIEPEPPLSGGVLSKPVRLAGTRSPHSLPIDDESIQWSPGFQVSFTPTKIYYGGRIRTFTFLVQSQETLPISLPRKDLHRIGPVPRPFQQCVLHSARLVY